MDIVKVAVIGAGAVARRIHLPYLKSNPSVSLEAVVEPDIKIGRSAARKFGIRNHFSSFVELVDSRVKVDAIIICAPPRFHAEVAIQALDAGIHVLCEKPLAEDLASGLKILEAARTKRASFMMGFNRRFTLNYQHARYLAHNLALGHVYSVQYESLQENPAVGWSKSDWFYSETEGGCLRDQGPHVFDILNWFLGKPVSVFAQKFTNLHTKIDESAFAVVKYDSGAIGVGLMSWLSPPRIEKIEVFGTSQNILASPEMFLRLSGSSLPDVELLKASSPMYASRLKGLLGIHKPSAYKLEIDHFISCIKSGSKPLVSIQDGIRALALSEAAGRSIQEKREVLL